MRGLMLALAMMFAATVAPAIAPAIARPIDPPAELHAGEIALGIDNLRTVGSVLYVAAHPDDENTRLLAWLASRGVRAGYLSITRGDGGQNLIGTEQDELLGLLRTHELLAARQIDGAEQLFTRARDFGYSKSAGETLRTWGHDEILGDVVLAVRRFRPDLIITRFTTEPPNHGHHTASAILAAEAFVAAADPAQYPEQLTDGVTPWQADRLLYNVSTWNLKPDADMSKYLKLDVGGYLPLLGRSIGQIAAESRSQHKSQGFGVAADRGPLFEYFTPLKRAQGKPLPTRDVLEELTLDWRRFQGTDDIVKAIDDAARKFDARAPHNSVPSLLKLHALLGARASGDGGLARYAKLKQLEVERLIVACSGVFLAARSKSPVAVRGSSIEVDLIAVQRSPAELRVTPAAGSKTTIVADGPVTTPYWLAKPKEAGRYAVDDAKMIGRPVSGAPLAQRFTLAFGPVRHQVAFAVDIPVTYAWVDPVRGELSRDVEIVPDVSVTFARDVAMVPNGKIVDVDVVMIANRDNVSGTLRLELPEGWSRGPTGRTFSLAARGESRAFTFRVTPPKNSSARIVVRALVDDKPALALRTVDHDHVPPLSVRSPSEVTLVPFELKTAGKRIGYISGPGDKVAESLQAVGYDVTTLSNDQLTRADLTTYDAIVVGVRAFNAEASLGQHKEKLLAYVANGGRLIVQYMTNSRIGPLVTGVWPYPVEIGRDRVTDETAPIRRLNDKDALWSKPNVITDADFDGWVQERGLYFASTWDAAYRPMISTNDPGDKPLEGALLVAKHGKGTFIYTGLAFFRQLPAGVPGAYRLFANMLAR